MHDLVGVGSELLISDPKGDFIFETEASRPVALISLGVGITPILSMLQHLATSDPDREVVFIHGAQDRSQQAFAAEVRRMSDTRPNIKVHIRFSDPRAIDFMGRDFDSKGFVDVDLVEQLVPKSADIYVCGAMAFMEKLRDQLVERGWDAGRFKYESFGNGGNVDFQSVGKDGSLVKFTGSDIEAVWKLECGSILELAEANGLMPIYSCRSGTCGSCEHRIVSGEVIYPEPPSFATREGHALICCAQPITNVELEEAH
jgi:ferredoxin-NADP reductase